MSAIRKRSIWYTIKEGGQVFRMNEVGFTEAYDAFVSGRVCGMRAAAVSLDGKVARDFVLVRKYPNINPYRPVRWQEIA